VGGAARRRRRRLKQGFNVRQKNADVLLSIRAFRNERVKAGSFYKRKKRGCRIIGCLVLLRVVKYSKCLRTGMIMIMV
jgi:hypothetical protein